MFKVGDKVRMIDCLEAENNLNKEWTIRSESWNVCGREVVLLKGRSGGFDVSKLVKVSD